MPEHGEIRPAGDPVVADPEPVEPARAVAFRDDMAAMHVQDPVAGRERVIKIVAVIVMFAAAILGIVSIAASSGANNSLDQGDAIVLGLFAITLAIIGTGTFIRYSLASVLRFWMARLTFEQSTQTNRVVRALHDTPNGGS